MAKLLLFRSLSEKDGFLNRKWHNYGSGGSSVAAESLPDSESIVK